MERSTASSSQQHSLPSLSYFRELHGRMRKEAAAVASAGLSPAAVAAPTDDQEQRLTSAVQDNIDKFLVRAPAGCRLSFQLRSRMLLQMWQAMRQTQPDCALDDVAATEHQLLLRSGCRQPSVYLSLVTDFIRRGARTEGGVTKDAVRDNETLHSIDRLARLVASMERLQHYEFPTEADVDVEGNVDVEVNVEVNVNGDVNVDVDMNVNANRADAHRADAHRADAHRADTCADTCAGPSKVCCRRCGTEFTPSIYYASFPHSNSHCRHHPGRVERADGGRVYSCCQASVNDASGCASSDWHVFEPFKRGGPVPAFPRLPSSRGEPVPAVALDAEMFYTAGGYEVSRVTVVDFASETTLLDMLILPTCPPVLDYNSRWSGITEEMYRAGGQWTVVTFSEARDRLAQIIGPETILIGHSLDNDLKVLRMHHDRIVDTAILYPHRAEGHYRMSLRALALGHLSAFIQQSSEGHDSREDCLTCIHLVKRFMERHQTADDREPV